MASTCQSEHSECMFTRQVKISHKTTNQLGNNIFLFEEETMIFKSIRLRKAFQFDSSTAKVDLYIKCRELDHQGRNSFAHYSFCLMMHCRNSSELTVQSILYWQIWHFFAKAWSRAGTPITMTSYARWNIMSVLPWAIEE